MHHLCTEHQHPNFTSSDIKTVSFVPAFDLSHAAKKKENVLGVKLLQ
jgi:hypothetical protein